MSDNNDGDRNIWDVIEERRGILAAFFVGVIFTGLFVLINNNISKPKEGDIMVIGSVEGTASKSEAGIVVEVGGAVNEPGLFEFPEGTRVGTAIDFAKGINNDDADVLWVVKNLNLAAKLHDGQKIYIPFKGEGSPSSYTSSSSSSLININTASTSSLQSLEGIGPVRSSSIIQGRPYGSISDLVSKNIIPSSVYDDIKDKISVY